MFTLFFIKEYYYHSYTPRLLREIPIQGAMPTQLQWDNLMWISQNTEPDSKILFFYFNDNPGDDIYHFFQSKRLSFYVPLSEIDSAIRQNFVKKDYKIIDNSVELFYKRDSKFPLKVIPLNKSNYQLMYIQNKSICDFDYIYGKIEMHLVPNRIYEQSTIKTWKRRIAYTKELGNILLENKNFEVVHRDGEAYIIRNYNPGGDCI